MDKDSCPGVSLEATSFHWIASDDGAKSVSEASAFVDVESPNVARSFEAVQSAHQEEPAVRNAIDGFHAKWSEIREYETKE